MPTLLLQGALALGAGVLAGALSSRLPASGKAALLLTLVPLAGLYLLLPLC